jgi:hypothetical protein
MGSEYRSWITQAVTLASQLAEMMTRAILYAVPSALRPCQDLDARLSTLDFPTQSLFGRTLQVLGCFLCGKNISLYSFADLVPTSIESLSFQ